MSTSYDGRGTVLATPASAATDTALLVGRLLLALLFLDAGFGKIGGVAGATGYIASKGLPMPELVAWATIAVELVAGAMLALGWRARWAALALAVFTMVAAVLFHDYWAVPPDQVSGQRINFMKNLAVTGGLLYVWAAGAGRWSVDRR
jgi:putative oxidoreductase